MFGFGLLSGIVILPLIGAALVLILDNKETGARNARWTALWTTLITFLLSLYAWSQFDTAKSGFQLVEKKAWIGEAIVYQMGVDGISMPFVLLTTFLMPFCILASWNSIRMRVKEYMACFLVLETMMIGVFTSLDLVLFYVFFEAGLIPMFLIIGIWGGKRRIYASFKFFLYTLLGSVLMLLAILAMNYTAQTTDIIKLMAFKFPPQMQTWLWLAFFASFAVKMPMWPVHTWLPDAHVEAPTAGSVILAGILLKMGGYGFLRFSLPMFPDASHYFAPLIFALSVVAIIYTSLVAMMQEDIKKLIAYSSVAHMGFVTMGLFTLNAQGVQGAVFQMVSHGLVSGALFLCVGVVYDRMHTREITAYGGLAHRMPALRRRLPHLHHGECRPSRHLRLRRRISHSDGLVPRQYLGRLLRDDGYHPLGGLCALAHGARGLRQARKASLAGDPRSRPARTGAPRAAGAAGHLLRRAAERDPQHQRRLGRGRDQAGRGRRADQDRCDRTSGCKAVSGRRTIDFALDYSWDFS